jgi:hypothetical protein
VRFGLIVGVLVVGAGGASSAAAVATDDEARLDGAIEAFNERMTDAGWESQGSMDQPSDGEDSGDDDGGLLPVDEEAFRECAGELFALFPGGEVEELPGQTAMSLSDLFASDLGALSGEIVGAVLVSVDDDNVGTATEFVEAFGSEETAECLSETLSGSGAGQFEDTPFEMEVDVGAEPDLEIGDSSAMLQLIVDAGAAGISVTTIGLDFAVAQLGNDLTALIYISLGEPDSGFDPRAELELIVDSLEG